MCEYDYAQTGIHAHCIRLAPNPGLWMDCLSQVAAVSASSMRPHAVSAPLRLHWRGGQASSRARGVRRAVVPCSASGSMTKPNRDLFTGAALLSSGRASDAGYICLDQPSCCHVNFSLELLHTLAPPSHTILLVPVAPTYQDPTLQTQSIPKNRVFPVPGPHSCCALLSAPRTPLSFTIGLQTPPLSTVRRLFAVLRLLLHICLDDTLPRSPARLHSSSFHIHTHTFIAAMGKS
jgi:hypothetical protein